MEFTVLLWLAAMVVFLLLEAATVAMVSLWFAAGSLGAMLVSLCHGPVWLQLTVFLVVSIVLLALLRPLARKFMPPKLRTNADSIPGSEGYVTADIDNLAATGSVKLGAMDWTARSTTGSPIPAGTRIRADRIEGVKVYVTPVKTPVSPKG